MNEQELLQFNNYIKKFKIVLDLSKRFKVTPEEITSFLFEIGLEALNKTEVVLTKEFKERSKTILEIYRDFELVWTKVNKKMKVDRK